MSQANTRQAMQIAHQRFAAGDRVTHSAFGVGTVVKSTLTRTDEELLVKFDRAGLKILSGMLAPLTK